MCCEKCTFEAPRYCLARGVPCPRHECNKHVCEVALKYFRELLNVAKHVVPTSEACPLAPLVKKICKELNE